jgi:hypothetical protein
MYGSAQKNGASTQRWKASQPGHFPIRTTWNFWRDPESAAHCNCNIKDWRPASLLSRHTSPVKRTFPLVRWPKDTVRQSVESIANLAQNATEVTRVTKRLAGSCEKGGGFFLSVEFRFNEIGDSHLFDRRGCSLGPRRCYPIHCSHHGHCPRQLSGTAGQCLSR